jgi:MFS family permease
MASTLSGLISIAAMPLYGYLGAKNPAIKRLLVSFSLLVGALVLFGRAVAPSMEFIIFVSVFYGLVSAGIFVLGFGMIREMFETSRAGVYLGVVGTMMAIGMLIGPFVTGLLIDSFSWRAACHVIWPFLLLSAILVFAGVKVSKEDAKALVPSVVKSFDLVGAVMLIIFLASVVLVLSLGASKSGPLPFGSLGNSLLIAAALVSLIVFILIVRKKGDGAILPIRVLKDPNTLCLTFLNLLCNFSMMAVFFFVPTYVLYVMKRPAMEAGLVTTVYSVLGLFLGPVFGRMIGKARNARGVLTSGTIVRIVTTVGFIFFLKPDTSIWVVYILMFIAGYYSSQNSVTMSAAPQIQIAPELRVIGNSVIQLSQNIGGAIGLSVYTMIIGIKGVADGMPIAFIISTISAVAVLIIGLFLKPLPDQT